MWVIYGGAVRPLNLLEPASSLLLGPLGLEFAIKLLDALFQFNLIALELVILGSQRLNVSVRRRPQLCFDEGYCVTWLLWLLVEANEHLGERVDNTRLLKVRSEFFLLLFGCLYRCHLRNQFLTL